MQMPNHWGMLLALPLALSFSATPVSAADEPSAVEEVSFQSAGAVLAGTLVIPPKILAAAVVVHGSGRDERTLPFAYALARQGVAILTYDKRGVGGSGGIYVGPEVGTNNVDSSNLALLAQDASSAVDELIRKLPANRGPVGLIGFSQAGWIIPLAAERNHNVQFMVLWSGPLATTHEQLRFQFYTQQNPDFWVHHTEAEAREHIKGDRDAFQFVDTDPRDALEPLSIPGLWLFGGRDVNVPVNLSLERLKTLIARGKPFEFRVFPKAGHMLDDGDAFPATMQWLSGKAPQIH